MPSPTAEERLIDAWRIHQAGRIADAEAIYRGVLAAQPRHASAWCYLGMACHDQGRFEEALAAYREAIRLQPDFPTAYNNLGNTLSRLRRLDESVASFDQALRLKPDYANAHTNKGVVLFWEGDVEGALASYRHALELTPDDAETHKNIGVAQLLLGNYAEGWREYAWRWKTNGASLPAYDRPRWDGGALEGRTILLTPEQGLGDTVQFIRYAAYLKQRHRCRTIFACPKALRELVRTCPGIDELIDANDTPPPFDVFSPLLDVAAVLGHGLADFPADVPYLSADESRVRGWRERLAHDHGVKIGIAWQGSPKHQADRMRSMLVAEFLPLARLSGLSVYSLQTGKAVEQIEPLRGRLNVVDLGSGFDDTAGALVDAAAVMKVLDLVITCDTSVGHVAGALGVPVWLALAHVPDWRWLLKSDTSPWYPATRLFRQARRGDWPSVFDRMADELPRRFPGLRRKRHDEYRIAETRFNRLTHGRHGLMLYNRHDTYVGRSIDRYGEYSPGEADVFRQIVRPGGVVVEAGASIGAHTLLLSRLVGERGTVYAFEPQRVVFQTLCANMALNSVTNVHCRPEALGEHAGELSVPALDYDAENNFAGLALAPAATGRPGERVPVVTLDSLELSRCDFLKVDVEGMELSVLRGAAAMLVRCRPLLYVENDRRERSAALIEHLLSLGYDLYWHRPALFNTANYFGNAANEFGPIVSLNMLGIHGSVKSRISGLRPITQPGDSPAG